ncbi:MAG: hypothetical protein JNM65_15925 [Verrucomicrobiaceae bacterium]|nr:hypothetical protein [Verrucomicrobiaceae bacterium]
MEWIWDVNNGFISSDPSRNPGQEVSACRFDRPDACRDISTPPRG